MQFKSIFQVVRALFIALAALSPSYSMSVSLQSTPGNTAPIGTLVKWEAAAADTASARVSWRFRARAPGTTDWLTIIDFSPRNTFDWVPVVSEGVWDIEATARDHGTGELAQATASFAVVPAVTDGTPVLTSTSNELVYVYSAPECAPGSYMSIHFETADGFGQSAPAMPCVPGKTMNTYVAGLRPATEYKIHYVVTSKAGTFTSTDMTFTTGKPALKTAVTDVLAKPSGPVTQGILLQSKVFEFNVATDFDGNLVWFSPANIRYLTRPDTGGYFLAIAGAPGAPADQQCLRQLDLASVVVQETNAARINEQLGDLGLTTRITSFHHEARRMANGKILALAGSERMLRDVQGDGEVDVIGDVILVLDQNMQVEWVWDAFDHLDVKRQAVLGEVCAMGGGGCPEFSLATVANDWLHGNALQQTPDGNILYSARHQDWVMKIDYRNGQGNGDVIWRLGRDGDFRIDGDSTAWFSHQHDPNIEDGSTNRLTLFDNGNTRHDSDPDANSRGQVLELDEGARTARLVLNVDLGQYSLALGSAQKLANGTYHFDLGWAPNGSSEALEYDTSGNIVSKIEVMTQQYRSFRMRNMYAE